MPFIVKDVGDDQQQPCDQYHNNEINSLHDGLLLRLKIVASGVDALLGSALSYYQTAYGKDKQCKVSKTPLNAHVLLILLNYHILVVTILLI